MKRRKYKYVLLLVDWLVINAAFFVAYFIERKAGVTGGDLIATLTRRDFLLFVAFSPIIMFVFQSQDFYKLNLHVTAFSQAGQALKCLMYASIALAVFMIVVADTRMLAEGRMLLFRFFAIASFLLIFERVLVMRTIFALLVRHNISKRRVLVIGTGVTARTVGESISRDNLFGLRLVGFLDDEQLSGTEISPGARVLGRIDDVPRVVEQTNTDEILVCLESIPEDRYLNILDLCARTRARVLVGSEQFSVITQHVYNENYGGMPLFGVMNSTPYMGAPVLKRIGDLVVSLVGLIVLFPFFALIAIAIKMDSPGPVLFKQIRIGKNGKAFTFLKFRSMYVGSDKDHDRVRKLEAFIKHGQADAPGTTKIVDRSKVTRIGSFIRRTSIDELPQLVNVLRGDMSIVGPRPCLPYEWEKYDEWHKRRLDVTPGCTGVWQVMGRSKVGFRDTVIIDLFYAQNMSFRLDLWLVLKTIPVMLFGTGGK